MLAETGRASGVPGVSNIFRPTETEAPVRPSAARRGLPPLVGLLAGAAVSIGLWALLLHILGAVF